MNSQIAIHEGEKVTVLYYDKKYCAWYIQLSNGGLKYTNSLTFK